MEAARPPLMLGAKAHVDAGDRATAMAKIALNMVILHYVSLRATKNMMDRKCGSFHESESMRQDSDEVVMSWKDSFEADPKNKQGTSKPAGACKRKK